jgi:AraC family transcriptional regulator, regulatory protein of adaptative response / methylated-DNA-[protein]-cysteine methyltransferase
MSQSAPATVLCESDDERWAAVRDRDRSAEGRFVVAVKTTGIYCRPGCPARLPNRGNVTFFASAAEARAAGYRACKRCRPDAARPDQQQADAVRRACRLIEGADEPPGLEGLAEAVGLSPSHLHRLFKRYVGVTPKGYAALRRANQARAHLRAGASVTEAIYAAGYGASSRFYDEAGRVLGMSPREFQNGAPGVEVKVAIAPTYLGPVLVAATARGICAIELGESEAGLRRRLRDCFPGARLVEDDPAFGAWVAQVVAFLEAPRRGLALPLDIQGTAFQRRVWEALRAIPAGQTLSYAAVAARIGAPKAVRAVAQACAANRLAVAIPCHRVVRSDGELGGYRGGLDRKRALLEREAK